MFACTFNPRRTIEEGEKKLVNNELEALRVCYGPYSKMAANA